MACFPEASVWQRICAADQEQEEHNPIWCEFSVDAETWLVHRAFRRTEHLGMEGVGVGNIDCANLYVTALGSSSKT